MTHDELVTGHRDPNVDAERLAPPSVGCGCLDEHVASGDAIEALIELGSAVADVLPKPSFKVTPGEVIENRFFILLFNQRCNLAAL